MIGDALYSDIVAAHEGLSADASARLNRKLVLLLADALDDETKVREAIRAARACL